MKTKLPPLSALSLIGFAAMSTQPAAAMEPFPAEHCIAVESAAPTALGVSTAYMLLLGERMQSGEMSREDFTTALVSFQNVTRLVLVDNEPEAACLLIAALEERYDLPRPDLDVLPSPTAHHVSWEPEQRPAEEQDQ